MAKLLSPADMIAILRRIDCESAEGYVSALHGIANQMAEEIREQLGIASMPADGADDTDAGLLVGFYPASPGQKLPQEFEFLDRDGDWTEKAPFNKHMLRYPTRVSSVGNDESLLPK